MDGIKNVPEIRFSGFSGEWEERELGELFDITSASRVHKNEWTESGIPFFRSSDVVADYKGQENNKAYISYELYKELSNKTGSVQKDDVLVTGGGSIGIPYLIKNNEPLYFKDADLLWLKNGNKINGVFIYTFFSTLGFRRYVNSITHIGTISHYTVEQAKLTPIKVPIKAEQEKIGKFLSKLDHLIILHQKKYNKLTNIKKAMLEKMFPKNGADVPEIRFEGFSGTWEERKLGEISPLRGGFAFQSNQYCEDGIPIIKISNILSTGEIGGEYDYYKEQVHDENYVLPNHSVLLAMSGATTGKVSILNKVNNKKFYQNQRVGYFVDKGIADYMFISTILRSNLFAKKLSSVLVAGAQPNVSSKEIDSFEFSIPIAIEEQQKIGNYFQNLDQLITLQQTQIEKLKNIKKACLEKMFV